MVNKVYKKGTSGNIGQAFTTYKNVCWIRSLSSVSISRWWVENIKSVLRVVFEIFEFQFLDSNIKCVITHCVIQSWFYYLILLTQNVGLVFFHINQFFTLYTPSGCPAIQFNSDTNYSKLAQSPRVKVSAPQDCSHLRCQRQVQDFLYFCLLAICRFLSPPSSVLIICYNGLQHSGRYFTITSLL